jgi:hypothetical protein
MIYNSKVGSKIKKKCVLTNAFERYRLKANESKGVFL